MTAVYGGTALVQVSVPQTRFKGGFILAAEPPGVSVQQKHYENHDLHPKRN